MKSFYLPVLILSVLIGSSLAVGIVTQKQTVRWEHTANDVENAALSENWDAADTHLASLSDSWEAWQTFLHVTLPHDHITEAEYEMEKVFYHAKKRDADHLLESLTELKGHFRTLSDQGELSLRNLL